MPPPARPSIAVVVMGDLARSPRMLNHARELAASGFEVVLIGYRGLKFDPPRGVRILSLEGGRGAPRHRTGLYFVVTAGFRMIRLFVSLFAALLRAKPRAILLQNPPSFPTLTASVLAAKYIGAQVVVDWHNYGFSLLAVRLGKTHWLVRFARWYEFRAARAASGHFCVSEAMREDLRRHGIGAEVLYDWPSREVLYDDRPCRSQPAIADSTARLTIVCPAGWTADEDIALLLDALEQLALEQQHDAAITVFITGDGPTRRELGARLKTLRAKGILMDTGFLPENEYWNLIGRAHLGLSLHRSSSGLDLAMKVVDLYSARIPVCALDYGGSIREQIEEDLTGFLFHTAQDLARVLARLASAPDILVPMRRAVAMRWQTASWSEEWKRVVLPALGTKSCTGRC